MATCGRDQSGLCSWGGTGSPRKGKRKPDLVCFLKMMWITYVLLVKKKRINIIQLLKAE